MPIAATAAWLSRGTSSGGTGSQDTLAEPRRPACGVQPVRAHAAIRRRRGIHAVLAQLQQPGAAVDRSDGFRVL